MSIDEEVELRSKGEVYRVFILKDDKRAQTSLLPKVEGIVLPYSSDQSALSDQLRLRLVLLSKGGYLLVMVSCVCHVMEKEKKKGGN